METFDFSKRMGHKRLATFAEYILELQRRIGFKVSARGWCYQLESERVINKDQFNKVEAAINRCRKRGLLPVDFTAEEPSRAFEGVVSNETKEPEYVLSWMLGDVMTGSKYMNPDWWKGEEYYIQMVVEKIDLVTLFSPVCEAYKIPIANTKGWQSIKQRAEYARRFKEAEDNGLKCLLLYCGDHDPDGLRIADTMRKNLDDVSEIVWGDGETGYDPSLLEIHRFGLTREFIEQHDLTWIDNLITGSGKDLASKRHPNHGLPYMQEYLRDIGVRKCEANALVPYPKVAREYVRGVILDYLGQDAEQRMLDKKAAEEKRYDDYLDKFDGEEIMARIRNQQDDDGEDVTLGRIINTAIKMIEEQE